MWYSTILPLKVETGRFIGTPLNLRLCELCQDSVIEDEVHFLLNCTHYIELRHTLFQVAQTEHPNFVNLSDPEKLQIFMQDPALIKPTAEYLSRALDKSTITLSVDVSWRR